MSRLTSQTKIFVAAMMSLCCFSLCALPAPPRSSDIEAWTEWLSSANTDISEDMGAQTLSDLTSVLQESRQMLSAAESSQEAPEIIKEILRERCSSLKQALNELQSGQSLDDDDEEEDGEEWFFDSDGRFIPPADAVYEELPESMLPDLKTVISLNGEEDSEEKGDQYGNSRKNLGSVKAGDNFGSADGVASGTRSTPWTGSSTVLTSGSASSSSSGSTASFGSSRSGVANSQAGSSSREAMTLGTVKKASANDESTFTGNRGEKTSFAGGAYSFAEASSGSDASSIEGMSNVFDMSTTNSLDMVDFSILDWKFGGFHPATNCVRSAVEISGLKMSRDGLGFKYISDLSGWGYSYGDYSGALACLFVCDNDGKWVGGKFDWISSSRNTRDFNNVYSGYNGWSLSNVPNPCPVAFVIVSKDGKKRSNVITAIWER